jgi:nucleoside-diphosphate-sugar epimerase
MTGKVVVTGASGFVGRQVVDALSGSGLEIHGVSRSHRGLDPTVMWHKGDLLDPPFCSRLFEQIRPSHLVHAAWYTEPGAYPESMLNLAWVEATVRVMSAFVEWGGQRSVMLGTCFEYDWSGPILSETTPRLPSTVYGASKAAVAELVASLVRLGHLDAAWARLFFMFGPHEHPRRLAASVVSAVLAGREAPMSHGLHARDYMYVGDVGDAIAAVLLSDVGGPVNIGAGESMTVRDLALRLARAAGDERFVAVGALEPRAGEPEKLVADITRLRDEVGWRPRYGIDEGIARTVRYWRDELGIA